MTIKTRELISFYANLCNGFSFSYLTLGNMGTY